MTHVRSISRTRRLIAVGAVTAMALAACGGDDDDSNPGGGDAVSGADSDSDGASDGGDDGGGGGDGAAGGEGSGGMVVVGDETITLDSSQCFLQEQDAAAGGGKILFVAQARGVNAAGENIIVDVSRYDEDSQFVGDDIVVNIGDPTSDDFVSLTAGGEIGTVTVEGSTVSAGGLTFTNFDDFSEQPGSFEINC